MTTSAATAEPSVRPWLAPNARLIVGLDGSVESHRALDWAIADAASRGGRLTIVHAWDWGYIYSWPSGDDRKIERQLAQRGSTVLAQARAKAAAAGLGEVQTELKHGSGPEVLAELGGDSGVVVVGTRHLSALSRLVLGSISSGTVSVARCPVVVVGDASTTSGPGRVIVGLSGTPLDQDLMAFGFDYARRHGLALRALLCFQPIPADLALPARSHWERLAAATIDGWAKAYPDVDARAEAWRAHAVDTLVDASSGQALLVIGRRTPYHRGIGLLGSVCMGLLHHAGCPVAVIPANAEQPAPDAKPMSATP